VLLLAACGGGGGTDTATSGSLTLRARWERAAHGAAAANATQTRSTSTAELVPASVSTVEVRVRGVPGAPQRHFVNPALTQDVEIAGLPPGVVTIEVFGYDLPFAQHDLLRQLALPPSYASLPIPVVIRSYVTVDACAGTPVGCTREGRVQIHAQPFATDFVPPLGATDVSPLTVVSFLLATAVGDVDRASIQVRVAGTPVVSDGQAQPGASLVGCDDSGTTPCGASRARMLRGFLVTFNTPEPYPPATEIAVVVSAADSQRPPRSFTNFRYQFTTGDVVVTPTATSTSTATATSTATQPPVATLTHTPPPTVTRTATSSATATRTAVPTTTATPSATPTATRTATVTASETPTETATPQPVTYIVTTTADSGPGSLRQAIIDANFDEQPSAIGFAPSLAGQIISVIEGDLAPIEESDTVINGDIDGDGRPDIQVDGEGNEFGFDIFADRTVIRGLAISSFSVGILLEVEAQDTVIRDCYIGVALDGLSDAHNFDTAIEVHGTGHRITNNVISSNLGIGLDVYEDAFNLSVTGNIIGASADRSLPLGNGDDAISIADGAGHRIGGSGPGEGNLIVANAGSGIFVVTFENLPRDVAIMGNQIGDLDLGGNLDGISVDGATNVMIGGSQPGAANVIQANQATGVTIAGAESVGVTLSRNSIANNGEEGILRLDGAELLVAAPMLERVGDTLAGTGLPGATIELFATDEPPDLTGAGEGETFLGSTVADENGRFSFPLPDAETPPAHVTATQTDSMGNTSEFARNIQVGATPTPSETPPDTPTEGPTATPTETETARPADTATPTPTVPDTPTETPPPTSTATPTEVPTPADTPTSTATATEAPTLTPTTAADQTPTSTSTTTVSETETATPTATEEAPPTPTPTLAEAPSPTSTATAVETGTATATPTEAPPTDTPTEIPTASPTLTPTEVTPDTVTPTLTQTSEPTPTATPSETATASETPTLTLTAPPSPTPSPTPTFGVAAAYIGNLETGAREINTLTVGTEPYGVVVHRDGMAGYLGNAGSHMVSAIGVDALGTVAVPAWDPSLLLPVRIR
jgi:hypothetical protein